MATASSLAPAVSARAPRVALERGAPRSLDELRALLPAPSTAAPALSTGLAALDAALVGRGIPRGRLTELLGPRGSGTTTLLRALVAATLRAGLGVAYVDAARTLAPRDWAPLATGDGFWVVRPRDAARGAWCVDILLRGGGAFALVVLDRAPTLTPSVAARLIRLARDANAAFVVTGGADVASPTMLAGALRLRTARSCAGHRRCPAIAITVEKGGVRGRRTIVEVEYVVSVARRVCTHPEVPDRRGVERSAARSAGAAVPAAPAVPVRARTLARSRRCAEPELDERFIGTVG